MLTPPAPPEAGSPAERRGQTRDQTPCAGLSYSGTLIGMATVTRTFLVDDLDGSTEDVENVRISLDGDELRDRPQRGERRPAAGEAGEVRGARHPRHAAEDPPIAASRCKPPASGRDQVQAVRDWARQNGYTVSARGRIPKSIQDAFAAAH